MTSSIGRYTYTVLALAIERMRELVSTSLLLSKILTFIFLSLCCYFSKSCTSVALSVRLDLYKGSILSGFRNVFLYFVILHRK
jgi:hypothetical protein